MNSGKHVENAFTGLEAAIVLIAFVVVAAVFAYVVLGAGFFTTQKAQQTVSSAVAQTSSTLELVGDVYGTGTGTGSRSSTIEFINFSVALAPGGTAIDFSKMSITYSNTTQLETLTSPNMVSSTLHEPVSGGWAITNIQDSPTGSSSTASTLLVQNEQFTISCWPTLQIPANDQINIDIKPSVGAAFTISRTAPAAIMGVNVLY